MLLIYRHRYILENKEILQRVRHRAIGMFYLTGFAMLTMAIAFITGTYVVLTPSPGLAIFLCVISLFIICSTVAFPSMIPELADTIPECLEGILEFVFNVLYDLKFISN